MHYLDGFNAVTGTVSEGGRTQLIGEDVSGDALFVNSGVGLRSALDPGSLSFDAVGDGFESFFRQGPRFKPTMLSMPPDCLEQGPHCHPGGEFSYVVDGEYFDAGMDGSVIRAYPAGSVVFYGQGSTHRPLSRDGARILYIPFDGILFGKDPEDLVKKMTKVGTASEAIEYALLWMVPEPARRRELEDALLNA